MSVPVRASLSFTADEQPRLVGRERIRLLEAVALIKAPFVLVARPDDASRTSARNQICGTLVRREPGGINTELTLDIGGGKTLTAVITSRSAEALGLAVGDRACGLFDAAHVILAVD